MKPEIKEEIYIQSYKHDGTLHRTWAKGYVIESDDEKVVAVTDRSTVIEKDGRRWTTREPAIYILFYHRWYNVIAMLRKAGLFYYVNIASPSLYDEEAIKNIDYDLDVKVYPDHHYQTLDKREYAYHKELMNYPEEIDVIVNHAMDKVCRMVEEEVYPFRDEYIQQYYQRYLYLKKEEEQK